MHDIHGTRGTTCVQPTVAARRIPSDRFVSFAFSRQRTLPKYRMPVTDDAFDGSRRSGCARVSSRLCGALSRHSRRLPRNRVRHGGDPSARHLRGFWLESNPRARYIIMRVVCFSVFVCVCGGLLSRRQFYSSLRRVGICRLFITFADGHTHAHTGRIQLWLVVQ